MSFWIGVDIGGTFTDFALFDAAGTRLAIHKQLTTPVDPSRAVLEGMRILVDREHVDINSIERIVHGTTLVTNAIIERRGARTGMLTTRGFSDILDMREEKRYDVFDLRIGFPAPVVERGLRREVTERMAFDGAVTSPLELDEVTQAAQELVADGNIEALAICFLHAYANPTHELRAKARVLEAFPDLYVTTSAEAFGGRREFERFNTACLNAFAQPMFDRYVQRLEEGLAELGFRGRLFVMSSSGGTLSPEVARAFPVRVVESGPAAGVQMSVFHGQTLEVPDVLSFDMGGTTAKGALISAGQMLKVYELEIARVHEFKTGSGLPLRTPVIDMIEIGAGGGSIAQLDARGTVKVGPRSAGADPGPACYGQGGEEPTLTDANLILGYLDAGSFLGGEMTLSPERAADAIRSRVAEPLGVTLERAAFGIHEIINEDVARAFRIHASERGFDYRNSAMVAFGGSGPLHALGVARKLRIPKVVFPVAAGVMSALGLLASPLAFEVATTRESHLSDLSSTEFLSQLEGLAEAARQPLLDAGLAVADIRVQYHLDMRYHGQGHEITVTLTGSASMEESWEALPTLFRERYAELYATSQLDTPLVITNWKVEASGPQPELRPGYHTSDYDARAGALAQPHAARRAWFEDSGGWVDTPVYQRYALGPGAVVSGPALIEEKESTIVVGVNEQVCVDHLYNLVAELDVGNHELGVQA